MVQVSSFCSHLPKDVGDVHSCQKARNSMTGSSEASADHCRMDMNEVESQVSSEAVDSDCALEQSEHGQAQSSLGKVCI